MNDYKSKTCWVCGQKLEEETVGFGVFTFKNFGSDERVYYLCSLCRNVVFNDMKRDRRHHKRGKR